MTDLSIPVIEVIANKSKGVQNDTFELKITGHRNPDELTQLKNQLETIGCSLEKAIGCGPDSVLWQCTFSGGVLFEYHFQKIDEAVAAAGFQQVCDTQAA